MANKFRIRCYIILVFSLILVSGCARPASEPVVSKPEEPVAVMPPAPEDPDPKELTPQPPPTLPEIHATVKRIFKDAAAVESSRKEYAVVGDFNGDRSLDIAIVIRPVFGKLEEMNPDYPNWLLRDPFSPNVPPQARKDPLRVEANDLLLAVVHGFGTSGWRSPEATQTFLLKPAVGSGMSAQSSQEFLAVNAGRPVPRVVGDTIKEVLKDEAGALYYTGAGYAWYNPRTYKPGDEKVIGHPGLIGAKTNTGTQRNDNQR